MPEARNSQPDAYWGPSLFLPDDGEWLGQQIEAITRANETERPERIKNYRFNLELILQERQRGNLDSTESILANLGHEG
jgi:hypothetical protein